MCPTDTALVRTDAARAAANGRCELCGGSRFEIISRRDRRGGPLDTAICRDCGLVCHREVPGDAELAEYYADQYRRDYHGESEPSARRVMRAWKNGQRIFRSLRPFLKGDEIVLEIGAGMGANVKVFQQHGHRASGIDPGEQFQRFGRERLRSNVERAGLFDLALAPAFDLVLLVHVIEHFSSPTRALRAIHKLLRPGGLLYVECPNLAAPFATRGRLFHFAHVYNFTPWTLTAMAGKCGFSLECLMASEESPNLQVLFRRVEHGFWVAPRDGYARTVRRINRYNWCSYHARPGYLLARLQRVFSLLHERLVAGRFVRRLCAGRSLGAAEE